jgi:hypothetical protein
MVMVIKFKNKVLVTKIDSWGCKACLCVAVINKLSFLTIK